MVFFAKQFLEEALKTNFHSILKEWIFRWVIAISCSDPNISVIQLICSQYSNTTHPFIAYPLCSSSLSSFIRASIYSFLVKEAPFSSLIGCSGLRGFAPNPNLCRIIIFKPEIYF